MVEQLCSICCKTFSSILRERGEGGKKGYKEKVLTRKEVALIRLNLLP